MTSQTQTAGSADETLEQFWVRFNGAVWRTCRKMRLSCSNCSGGILRGERYLDTMENDGRVWATMKLCERCATKPRSNA